MNLPLHEHPSPWELYCEMGDLQMWTRKPLCGARPWYEIRVVSTGARHAVEEHNALATFERILKEVSEPSDTPSGT